MTATTSVPLHPSADPQESRLTLYSPASVSAAGCRGPNHRPPAPLIHMTWDWGILGCPVGAQTGSSDVTGLQVVRRHGPPRFVPGTSRDCHATNALMAEDHALMTSDYDGLWGCCNVSYPYAMLCRVVASRGEDRPSSRVPIPAPECPSAASALLGAYLFKHLCTSEEPLPARAREGNGGELLLLCEAPWG